MKIYWSQKTNVQAQRVGTAYITKIQLKEGDKLSSYGPIFDSQPMIFLLIFNFILEYTNLKEK